jgi:predicted ATP-binding protein involved in virulence
MYLEKLEISNYKMFDNIKLEFEPGFNIILGDNGVGKTTILEAASVAISGFLTGMEDVPTRNIYKQDVRYEIVKDSMGIPNKIYNDESTQIRSVLKYNDKSYEWVRAKKNSSSSTKTTMNPKDIQDVSQKLINSMQAVLPLISYQSAARHWLTARADADVKKIKQLHDRRCGYLGCLDRKLNLNSVYDWCMQMEWNSIKAHKEPQNYKTFMKIISDFMCYMNDGVESEVIYDVNSHKLLYVEKGICKEIEDLSAGYQSMMIWIRYYT